jgi:hypothetical protein
LTQKNQYRQIIVSSPAASFYHGAYFGEGSGPIFVDDLQCEDNSTHINNCSYVTYDNCYHFNDVSVVCTGKFKKQLEILNENNLTCFYQKFASNYFNIHHKTYRFP